MKITIKGITTILFVVCLSILSGCGDDEGLPYNIEALDPVIDLSNPASSSGTYVAATLFDTKGNPMTGGTMVFSLNDDAAGYFWDEEKKMRVHSLSVDIKDGDIPEVWFQATNKPETVVVSAYCPGYPHDKVIRTTIRVINGEFQADFTYLIDEATLNVNFYDQSGFDDANGQSIAQWTWNIRDETTATNLAPIVLTGDGTFSYGFFSRAEHNITVTLTILGSDGATSTSTTNFDIPAAP